MADSQVLELLSVDHFDSEISEILKGMTSLSNFVPICGDPACMLYEMGKMRDEVIGGKIRFLGNLNKEIVDRDISEEKMKNAFCRV